jgi:uncharacterized membrane protein
VEERGIDEAGAEAEREQAHRHAPPFRSGRRRDGGKKEKRGRRFDLCQ